MTTNELKEEFLQTLIDKTLSWSYVGRAEKALKKMQRAEKIVGGNVWTYSEDEARALFAEFRKSSQFTALHFTRKFVRWCIENGVDGARHSLLNFRPDDELEKTRLEMVANPIGLQSVLDEAYPPASDNTVSNVYRCLAWCGFAGVPQDDTLILTADNIDFAAGMIRVNGTDYFLYTESIPAFRSVCENTWFYSDHPNHDHVVRNRVDGNLLLRGITANVEYKRLLRRFAEDFDRARERGKTKSRVKYETILKSGMFFRVSESETENTPADFAKEIEKHIDSRYSEKGYGYRLHGEDITEKMAEVVENKTYEEYYRWQLAFLPV